MVEINWYDFLLLFRGMRLIILLWLAIKNILPTAWGEVVDLGL
jgi:hypothetical protein